MNEVIQQLHDRKSVRVFTEQEIPAQAVTQILQAAAAAPTAGNQQLYTILQITDPKLKEALSRSCDNQPFIAQAKLVLVFCADCLKWYHAFLSAGCQPRKPGVGDLLLAVDDALIAEIATAIVQQMDASIPANAPWAVADVPAGYTVACEAGVQVILRSGQASCDGTLVDLSDGETLTSGNLTANHLYTADAQGRTLTSQGCTLLIAGSYTVR